MHESLALLFNIVWLGTGVFGYIIYRNKRKLSRARNKVIDRTVSRILPRTFDELYWHVARKFIFVGIMALGGLFTLLVAYIIRPDSVECPRCKSLIAPQATRCPRCTAQIFP